MNWIKEISCNKVLQTKLSNFLSKYGIPGLEQALQLYTDMQQEYICCTKTSTSKVKYADIYYIEIQGHHITTHTENGTFSKYGSLSKELKTLSNYGFVKCNQSCIVSLSKIKTIIDNNIIFTNNESVHMSRTYASKVILAFHKAPQ